MAEQGVTVVVPTLNRRAVLADCLRDLLAQDHRPLEILVVDQSGEADPGASKLAAENAETISYHRVDFRGLPKARNYGWQHAKYDAVVYVDDDIRCEPGLVSEHLRCLNQPGVGIVGGGIDEANKPPDRRRPTGRFNPWLAESTRGFSDEGEIDVDHVPGGNFAAHRGVIRTVGGFDEVLDIGAALYEEAEFCLRAGSKKVKMRYNGRARLRHMATADGGCRVEVAPDYVRGLAHNRGVLIRRHTRLYHWPTALLRVAQLAVAYALHYRRPACLVSWLPGLLAGLRNGGKPPLCTDFRPAQPAKAEA